MESLYTLIHTFHSIVYQCVLLQVKTVCTFQELQCIVHIFARGFKKTFFITSCLRWEWSLLSTWHYPVKISQESMKIPYTFQRIWNKHGTDLHILITPKSCILQFCLKLGNSCCTNFFNGILIIVQFYWQQC